MPKIVKIRRYEPPNLSSKFSSHDITPAAGTDFGSSRRYDYNDSKDLRLWLRFAAALTDTVQYDTSNTPALTYTNNPGIDLDTKVYSSRMKTAIFDQTSTSSALVTFPGGSGNDNILSFGDGTNDSPFSISLWYKRDITASSSADLIFWKGKPQSSYTADNSEFQLIITASTGNILFQIFDADRNTGSQADRQNRSTAANTNVTDGNWHHIVLTYDGSGGSTAANGMKIYLDGAESLSNPGYEGGTYVAMEKKSERFYVGVGTTDGSIGELGIWAKELSLDSIKAIYHWTREDSVVKSGYTNLPSRIQQRALDNRPGCYPTKHRMGDKDRSGKANIFYEDLAIQFGNKIKDDFTNVPETDLITAETGFDSTKWVVSKGMTIRREATTGKEGILIIDRCATFSGKGTSLKRFIRSSKKIRNPYRFYFELIEGPYNTTATLLNLRQGFSSETLKLQIATDAEFASPTTIATYTPSLNPNKNYTFIDTSKKPRRVISLSTSDFPDLGQPYYFRLLQETYSNNKNVWAIANIEVEFANQNINYATRLNHTDTAGNKFAKKSYSLPHISGTLTGLGKSVKGVSDINNPFQEFDEPISAFNETLTIENAATPFFNSGLNPDVYPGFTSPVRSKTKFTIDLNPASEATFGYTETTNQRIIGSSGTPDPVEHGQQLMVYWNNVHKRWEKKGRPLGRNFTSTTGAANTVTKLLAMVSQSCVGFSPLSLIGTASYVLNEFQEDFKFHDTAQLRLSNQPITDFGFPFSGQYHGTASNIIKAKDIGITKPFLLEGISYAGEGKFELPRRGGGDVTSDECLSPAVLVNKFVDGQFAELETKKIITPTFFMLKQHKENFSKKVNLAISEGITTHAYQVTIPGMYNLESGSNVQTLVEDTRELITYSNMRLFVTRSSGLSGIDVIPSLTFQDMINQGLTSDLDIIIDDTTESINQLGQVLSLTQSFVLNSNVRNKTKSNPSNVLYFPIDDTVASSALLVKNQTSTRGYRDVGDGRAIVNGHASIKNDPDKAIICSTGQSETPLILPAPALNSIDLESPYLILPEDELILGWQYPLGYFMANRGFPNADTLGRNSMTLGQSQLHLYGSLISENKEFHETINQNLTSCAVYEHIIGGEKVIDQWQVSYAGELTGSVKSYGVFEYDGSFAYSNPNAYKYAYNAEYVFDTPSDIQVNDAYRINDIKKIVPTKRIGLNVFSTTNGLATLRSLFAAIGASEDNANIFYTLLPATQKHIRSRDEDRVFSDGEKLNGEYYDNSSYGTYNLTDSTGGRSLTNHRPKYRYNTEHFGYYSDLLQQGKDTRFKTVARQGFTSGFDIVVNSRSPIKAIFVESEVIDGSEQKRYKRKKIEFLLDDENFQSSNINTFSTSSVPFIDDNTPRNRIYITNPIITLTP